MYRRSMSAFQFVSLLPNLPAQGIVRAIHPSQPFFFFSAMAWSTDSFAVGLSAARGSFPRA